MHMKHYLSSTLQFLIGFAIQTVMIIIGLPLVAVGLKHTRQLTEPVPFTQYPGSWSLVRLPTWMKLWDNVVDGLLGDRRGKWASQSWNKPKNPWPLGFSMWWWAAVRNPANYFKRFILSCDVRKCKTYVVAGQNYVRDDLASMGFQLLAAESAQLTYYHLYWVRRWGTSNRAIVVELGFKFRLWDEFDESDRDDVNAYKGFTFEVAPFKDIG